MQSPLFIDLKYLDNISITEEYQLLNYSVILISNIMKMNIFKIDLNFKQGSITDYIAIPDLILLFFIAFCNHSCINCLMFSFI